MAALLKKRALAEYSQVIQVEFLITNCMCMYCDDLTLVLKQHRGRRAYRKKRTLTVRCSLFGRIRVYSREFEQENE
jgi:hypothetical protein